MKVPFKIGVRCLFAAFTLWALTSESAVAANVEVGGTTTQALTLASRKLTQEQYIETIRYIFGPTVNVGTRFEPGSRVAGLLEVGASALSVTAVGAEQYDDAARAIAAQVVDDSHRGTFISCVPRSAEFDRACAADFLGSVGRLLYRRPLSNAELGAWMRVVEQSARSGGGFYAGLETGVASMLTAPQFLFRWETLEAKPNRTGKYELDAFSKASRLSFFLWNSGPDDALLRAAHEGRLDTQKGLEREVDRMLRSPRLEAGVRAYFADMLQFDKFETLAKDPTLYPKFSIKVKDEAREQTLRTIADHIVTRNGDYRDLLVTQNTFLTPALGAVYRVPVPSTSPNGKPTPWMPYRFADGDPRAGILSNISFTALHSHPGRSSPTLRGRAVRELLLCQPVPNPPANVNFTVVQDTKSVEHKTARSRLNAHATDAVCKGCHKITDPIGLTLESFDSSGEFRAVENGETIDTGADFSGRTVANVSGLATALRNEPALASCLATRLYSYFLGRPLVQEDSKIVLDLLSSFAATQYRVPALMRTIAVNKKFYSVPKK